MYKIKETMLITALLLAAPMAMAAGEKDCLLQGTVHHGEQADQNATNATNATTVKINSISQYDEDTRCNMRRGQKVEFKLPQDTRVKEAPSGSEVKYRYRTDESGQSSTELISVGA